VIAQLLHTDVAETRPRSADPGGRAIHITPCLSNNEIASSNSEYTFNCVSLLPGGDADLSSKVFPPVQLCKTLQHMDLGPHRAVASLRAPRSYRYEALNEDRFTTTNVP